MRELILAVAAIRMNENDFRQFQNFCDSMKKAATTRNHIVHGKWQVKIKTHINDTGEKIFTPTEWQRFYAPVDQTQYQNIFGPGDNQKAKATSCYSANRIDQLGNDIRELSLKITNWCKSIQLADLTDPVPLELSQPYTRKD